MGEEWSEAADIFMKLAEVEQREQALHGEKQILFSKLSNIFGGSKSVKREAVSDPENEEESQEKPQVKKRKKEKKEKYEGPKRPMTPYALYCRDNYQRCKVLAGEKNEKPFKVIGAEWNVLPEPKKKSYYEMAEIDTDRYAKELREYHNKFPERATEKERKFLAIDPEERKKASRAAKEKRELGAQSTTEKKEPPPTPTPSEKKNEGVAPESSKKRKKRKKKKSSEGINNAGVTN